MLISPSVARTTNQLPFVLKRRQFPIKIHFSKVIFSWRTRESGEIKTNIVSEKEQKSFGNGYGCGARGNCFLKVFNRPCQFRSYNRMCTAYIKSDGIRL